MDISLFLQTQPTGIIYRRLFEPDPSLIVRARFIKIRVSFRALG